MNLDTFDNLSKSLTIDFNQLISDIERMKSKLLLHENIAKIVISSIKWAIRRRFYLIEKCYIQFFQIPLKSFHFSSINQHKKIMNEILTIISKWEKKQNIDELNINILINDLNDNFNFEKAKIFPELEKKMTLEQQKQIHKKLNSKVNLGFYPLKILRAYGFKLKKLQ